MKLSAFDKWLTYDWREDEPTNTDWLPMCSCDEGGNRGCEIHKEEK